jgi:hypothetical protein
MDNNNKLPEGWGSATKAGTNAPQGWGDPAKAANFAETPTVSDTTESQQESTSELNSEVTSDSVQAVVQNEKITIEPVQSTQNDIPVKKLNVGVIAVIVALVVLVPVSIIGGMYLFDGDGESSLDGFVEGDIEYSTTQEVDTTAPTTTKPIETTEAVTEEPTPTPEPPCYYCGSPYEDCQDEMCRASCFDCSLCYGTICVCNNCTVRCTCQQQTSPPAQNDVINYERDIVGRWELTRLKAGGSWHGITDFGYDATSIIEFRNDGNIYQHDERDYSSGTWRITDSLLIFDSRGGIFGSRGGYEYSGITYLDSTTLRLKPQSSSISEFEYKRVG